MAERKQKNIITFASRHETMSEGTKWRVNELRRGRKGAKESNIKARAYIRLYYNLSF